MINAEQLTDGLKNEKVRWAEYLIELAELKKSIVGNVFLSTCSVVYCGPYSGKFRSKFVDTCVYKLKEI